MSNFDGLSEAVFSTVENVMGDTASWTPSNSSIEQIEIVLFNKPDKDALLGDTDKYAYDPYDYSFEYYQGQFIELKSLVDSGEYEKVTINGINLEVREVKTIVDGRSYKAYCTPFVVPVEITNNPQIG